MAKTTITDNKDGTLTVTTTTNNGETKETTIKASDLIDKVTGK